MGWAAGRAGAGALLPGLADDTPARRRPIYGNAGIATRHSCVPADWYERPHGWAEKNALCVENSVDLLERVLEMMRGRSYELGNLDATLIAQVPRLSPYQAQMRKNLASLLGSPQDRINLKVTSTDHLGALGREEGMAALVVVLLVASGGSGAGE